MGQKVERNVTRRKSSSANVAKHTFIQRRKMYNSERRTHKKTTEGTGCDATCNRGFNVTKGEKNKERNGQLTPRQQSWQRQAWPAVRRSRQPFWVLQQREPGLGDGNRRHGDEGCSARMWTENLPVVEALAFAVVVPPGAFVVTAPAPPTGVVPLAAAPPPLAGGEAAPATQAVAPAVLPHRVAWALQKACQM